MLAAHYRQPVQNLSVRVADRRHAQGLQNVIGDATPTRPHTPHRVSAIPIPRQHLRWIIEGSRRRRTDRFMHAAFVGTQMIADPTQMLRDAGIWLAHARGALCSRSIGIARQGKQCPPRLCKRACSPCQTLLTSRELGLAAFRPSRHLRRLSLHWRRDSFLCANDYSHTVRTEVSASPTGGIGLKSIESNGISGGTHRQVHLPGRPTSDPQAGTPKGNETH